MRVLGMSRLGRRLASKKSETYQPTTLARIRYKARSPKAGFTSPPLVHCELYPAPRPPKEVPVIFDSLSWNSFEDTEGQPWQVWTVPEGFLGQVP